MLKKTKLQYLIPLLLLAGFLIYKFGREPFRSLFFNEYYLSDETVLAIFDRDRGPRKLAPEGILHYKAVLKNTGIWSAGSFEEKMDNQDILITVETWLKGTSYHKNVLHELLEGHFDRGIHQLAKKVAKGRHKIYIRWAPDMEVPVKIYPWQYQSSAQYCRAFRYFAKEFKRYAAHALIVWGPSGYPGDTEYWPGDGAVDFVSITLGSPSESSLNVYPKDQTLPDMLKHKLHRLRFIHKPVLVIRSAGVPNAEFKTAWLSDQMNYMLKHRSVVYSEANYVDTGKLKPLRKRLEIGVFDPNKKLVHEPFISTEHVFTDWGEIQNGDFEKRFLEVVGRGHDPIVSMEPWHDLMAKKKGNVLDQITSGAYDAEIRKLFKVISSVKNTVYLRWMHEMEIPIHRYDWQSQDPLRYINTFRYFMQFEGGPGKNVKKIWGPAGDRGAIDFWPGDDVVDFISIAIYGLPDKNITDPAQQESFRVIFERKFRRMRFSGKPLFITEFGVKGPEKFQDQWLHDAAETIRDYPQIFGVCYFNLYDNPKVWGDIAAPDWSISVATMRKFVLALRS